MLQFFRHYKNCNSLVPGTGMLQFFRTLQKLQLVGAGYRNVAILRYQAPRCCDSYGGSGMKAAELTIEVVCQNLPGSCFSDTHGENPKKVGPIYLGIQKGNDVIEIVPGDRQQATFHPTFRVTRQTDGSPNFLGAFAKGTAQERFF